MAPILAQSEAREGQYRVNKCQLLHSCCFSPPCSEPPSAPFLSSFCLHHLALDLWFMLYPFFCTENSGICTPLSFLALIVLTLSALCSSDLLPCWSHPLWGRCKTCSSIRCSLQNNLSSLPTKVECLRFVRSMLYCLCAVFHHSI